MVLGVDGCAFIAWLQRGHRPDDLLLLIFEAIRARLAILRQRWQRLKVAVLFKQSAVLLRGGCQSARRETLCKNLVAPDAHCSCQLRVLVSREFVKLVSYHLALLHSHQTCQCLALFDASWRRSLLPCQELFVPDLVQCISVFHELVRDNFIDIVGRQVLGSKHVLNVLVDQRGTALGHVNQVRRIGLTDNILLASVGVQAAVAEVLRARRHSWSVL